MKILFQLTNEDAQELAYNKFKSQLTEEELDRVKKILGFGFEGWDVTMLSAIQEVLEERKNDKKEI